MRILVTGGSGFIGRNLVEYLRRTHEVLAPTRHELDISNPDAVDDWFGRNRVDAVVHGALRPGHRNANDTSGQLSTNLRMAFGILRNAHRFGRLIFLSSGAVYDIARPQDRVTEDQVGLSVPADEHGLSKYVMGQYFDSSHQAALLDVVELRLFGVFGRHEDYAIRFISNAICKTLFGLPITLRQNRTFSYLYVDDLGPVVDAFLTGDHAHAAYNVVPDWTDDLHDLAVRVRARSGKDLPIVVASSGDGLPYSGSNNRLRQELPELTFTPIDDAIDALYAWYEANRSVVDYSALSIDK